MLDDPIGGPQRSERPGTAGSLLYPGGLLDHSVLAPPAASASRTAARAPTAVAARAATAPGATLGLWARLVHDQVAIAEEPPVEHLDRFRGLFFRRHLDEAESARPARELVGDDPHGLHDPRLRK